MTDINILSPNTKTNSFLSLPPSWLMMYIGHLKEHHWSCMNRTKTILTSREKTSSVIQPQKKQEKLNLNNYKKLWYVSIANISIINLHQLITCLWWQIMCSLVIQEMLLSFIKSLRQYQSAVPLLSMLLSVSVAWRQFCCIVILLFFAYTNQSCIGSSIVSFTSVANFKSYHDIF